MFGAIQVFLSEAFLPKFFAAFLVKHIKGYESKIITQKKLHWSFLAKLVFGKSLTLESHCM
jgi:hypothetical protein